MSDIAVRVEGLGKQYRLGQREYYRTLRDGITLALAAPFRTLASLTHRQPNHEGSTKGGGLIWALDDISFEVKRGDAVGIIGRNGAGKSTLLKILSRITEPTKGFAEIHGRVGSLLEVGTGFHPELTGRENIQLNGAILGMHRSDIQRKFDEIVAFAEIETFLDTPVKHYSSGMYVRLAFAVAAHLEPEILLVDEVLAVGDAAFQKKCLGKMQDVAGEGRTVLFVSHNLASLANLCPRAILLVQGKKHCEGESDRVITEYLAVGRRDQGEISWPDPMTAPGNDHVRLKAVRIISKDEVTANVDIEQAISIQMDFWNFKPGARVNASIHLLDKMGVPVLASSNLRSANLIVDEWSDRPYSPGVYRTVCTLPGNFLNEGPYSINVILLTDVTRVELQAREILAFTVYDTGSMRKEYGGIWIGVVRPRLPWRTEYLGALTDERNEETN